MTDSATLGRRERRKQETSTRITAVSRRLTVERGLAGFTIDEVCYEVDLSRRTFFNYFASKEDAVLGADSDEDAKQFQADFLARGAGSWHRVVDDGIELLVRHFETTDIDSLSHGELMLALEKEPRLLAKFVGLSRDRQRAVAELIAQRQGVAKTDPRAAAAASIVWAVLHSASEQLMDPANTRDFATILTDCLKTFRALLAPPAPRKDAS